MYKCTCHWHYCCDQVHSQWMWLILMRCTTIFMKKNDIKDIVFALKMVFSPCVGCVEFRLHVLCTILGTSDAKDRWPMHRDQYNYVYDLYWWPSINFSIVFTDFHSAEYETKHLTLEFSPLQMIIWLCLWLSSIIGPRHINSSKTLTSQIMLGLGRYDQG